MQIQTIKAFVMLCKEKNISKCSEKLHISQQGLSRQIRSLENEVGARLFVRNNRGVELTEEGMLLLPRFEKVWESYSMGMRELDDYRKNHQEMIRIAVCPGIKQAFGLDFFMKFQQENPGIKLKLDFQSDVVCEEALCQGNVDAAFLDWPVHKEEFDTYLVVRSPLVAVMRRDNPLSSRTSISMRELSGMQIYIPDESHRMSQRFAKYWPEFYHSVNIDFTSNDYDSFYHDLPKNLGGVALTFRFLCRELDPQLAAVSVEEESFVSLYYCIKKDHAESMALSQFSNYVYRNMKLCE
ncbi:MAG: LysR family transcriptional regulator [Bariatricus sp.]